FERVVDAAESGKGSGQARTQEAIVESSEEKRGAEAEFSDAIAEAIRHSFDQAVEAQSAKLIGDGALGERFWIAAGQAGKVVAQIGAAEALGSCRNRIRACKSG